MKISRAKWYARLGYTPRNGQRALDEAADRGHRFLAMFAYPRAGKSYGAAKHIEPLLLGHDCHVWIVAPTYELGSKEFGYIWSDMMETGFLRMASHHSYDIRGGNMNITWPWGAFLRVVSADNPSGLRAEELDAVILAEASALNEDIFYRYLYARVEKRKGRVLIPTTPKGHNWIYETFRIPSLPPGHPALGGSDNPRYDPAFWSAVVSAVPEYGDILEPGIYDEETIVRARKTMPLPLFKEQFGGDFSSYAGLIYPWNPATMLVEPFSVPNDWVHIVGWDPGARDENPTAIQIGSYSPDGVLYWWGEIYEGNRSIREYATKLNILAGGRWPSFISTDKSARQVRIELARLDYGWTITMPHESLIDARIIRKTQLMLEGKWKVFKGRCPNLVREIQSWEWDEKNPGKPRPHQSCHALDATGYAELIPVTQEETIPDPLAPRGESPEISRFWRGTRKIWQKREEEAELQEFVSEVEDNPFEETLVVEDYVPGL